ncbi:MAG TPA: long-chain fatty acid--CoA ligase [Arenicellales bacterium]|jgi:long-chain acyl-CoA synthetase|nr:long-chain fatty acid--CoA ligase [Arenicellales bacterium]
MSTEDIISFDNQTSIPALFRFRAQTLKNKVAMREKHFGIWRTFSWDQYYSDSARIGKAMITLGLESGQTVSILADPCKEWLFFDLAAQCIGCVSCGIYATDSAPQILHICEDSDTTLLMVENEEQLDKYLAVEEQLPNIHTVVVLDSTGLVDLDHPKVIMLEQFYRLGDEANEGLESEWNRRIDNAEPNDTAILVYTSGTTGAPKGAMLSHRNIIFIAHAFHEFYPITAEDDSVVYLPLCHVTERLLSVFLPLARCSTVNFIEGQDTAFENITEVSPTYFLGVPRIWEKMYSSITMRMKDATWFGRKALQMALSVGSRAADFEDKGLPVPAPVRLMHRAADLLVLNNIKVLLGLDHVRIGLTGAAPISPDLIGWFRALGVPLYEAFGQTENVAFACGNYRGQVRLGTVGKPPPGVELKTAEDGELLIRGPLVFKGYYKQALKTAETIVDGWLYTGDIAEIDGDGFVKIVDRKKDIIITSGGKNISPSEIENQLKFSPYVTDAVVIGDRRKYLTCLVMVDNETVSQFAQENNVPFSDFKSLCATAEVQELIKSEIERINLSLAQAETLKKFRLIDKQLTVEDDELTASMKLKRNVVNEKYADLIDQMYS